MGSRDGTAFVTAASGVSEGCATHRLRKEACLPTGERVVGSLRLLQLGAKLPTWLAQATAARRMRQLPTQRKLAWREKRALKVARVQLCQRAGAGTYERCSCCRTRRSFGRITRGSSRGCASFVARAIRSSWPKTSLRWSEFFGVQSECNFLLLRSKTDGGGASSPRTTRGSARVVVPRFTVSGTATGVPRGATSCVASSVTEMRVGTNVARPELAVVVTFRGCMS